MADAKVAPILLGPANAEAATGLPWRWCRDFAAAHGVRFVGSGKKRALIASEFVAALERASASPAPATEPANDDAVQVDHAEELRRRLGKRKRVG